MIIPEEAVARAARLISTVDYPNYDDDPDFARAVLEVAAPFIAAEALREAARDLPRNSGHPRYSWVNYSAWLRKRATNETQGES